MSRYPVLLAPVIWVAIATPAHAGMSSFTLTEIAKTRLDALSFFLFLFFVMSWLVKLLWNHMGKTFTSMPRLSYKRALGLVLLSGLLFYVVLTMISGTRELLTPGAWEKQGATYRLRDDGAGFNKTTRKTAMRELQTAIWAYAEAHDGNAPAGPLVDGIDRRLWRFPGGGFYSLMPGVKPGVGRHVLVYEPSSAGYRRFVLLADGSIEDRTEGELKGQLDKQMELHIPND